MADFHVLAFEPPMNTCPICDLVWEITQWNDCLVPACGCYGTDPWSGKAPCEPCGIAHAMACPKIERVAKKVNLDGS